MKKSAVIVIRSVKSGLPTRQMNMLMGKPVFMYTVESAIKADLFEHIYCLSTSNEILDLLEGTCVDTVCISDEDNMVDDDLVEKYCLNMDELDYFVLLNCEFPCRTENQILDCLSYFETNYGEFSSVITAKQDNGVEIMLDSIRVINPKYERKKKIGKYYLCDAETLQVNNDWTMECAFAWHFKKKDLINNDIKVERIINNKRNFESQINEQDILFVGHSIFDYWDIDKIDNYVIHNYGIAGITTYDYYHKVILEGVINNVPNLVYINLGINDVKYSDFKETILYISKIVEWLRSKNPNCCIYCIKQHKPFYRYDYNESKIEYINSEISKISEVKIIECNEMENEYGHLRYDYTKDGLHFSERGYEAFRKVIEKTLL